MRYIILTGSLTIKFKQKKQTHVCHNPNLFFLNFYFPFNKIYGSENKKLIGIVLQRNLIIFGITSLIIMSFLVNGESILLILGQDPSVAQ